MNNIEQRALEIERGKLSYRLLNIHIVLCKVFYGREHDKTKQLLRKRDLIDCDTIQRVRDAQRAYQVLRGKVKLLSGDELGLETNKELDKLLHNKGE